MICEGEAGSHVLTNFCRNPHPLSYEIINILEGIS